MSYDNTCKYLAEQYPSEFVRWLLATETNEIEILKTELIVEPIRADSIVFLRTANQILHLEFQTLPPSNPPIPLRMLDDSVRLKRHYRCAVVQVVIFLQETTNEIAFTEAYQDETTLHQYRVIRLWEQNPTIFLDNPGLLPLAPLSQANTPQGLLAQVADRMNKMNDREQRQNLAACTQILAGLRFDKDLLRQIFREDIMKESVIYQDIWEQSRKKEALSIVIRQLNRRFGKIEPSSMEAVQALESEQLEELGEALLDFSSVTDLATWLQQQKVT